VWSGILAARQLSADGSRGGRDPLSPVCVASDPAQQTTTGSPGTQWMYDLWVSLSVKVTKPDEMPIRQ
jgi:hypothetical protein